MTLSAAQFQGPIPPPELLAKYDEILPGAAERILTMAESQTHHRQGLEQLAISGANSRANRGQWMGLVVALVFLAAAVGLITNGYPTPGTILGSVDITGLVAVFVVGRADQRKERVQKAQYL